jgi:hypothetical protein
LYLFLREANLTLDQWQLWIWQGANAKGKPEPKISIAISAQLPNSNQYQAGTNAGI